MRMPALFIGHGSPMNAIEDNEFTREWKAIAASLPRPKAILCVSAHWYTDGTRVMKDPSPKTIYDMVGFPKALYEIIYNAPGAPELAEKAKSLITHPTVFDSSWGFDHGTWSVLHIMYPERNIPVFQLSIDGRAPAEEHFRIGQELASLRNEGVMILGSGNVVHNLRRVQMNMKDGFDWAQTFDNYIKQRITDRRFEDVVHHTRAGESAAFAFPTPDHYYPLLYVLGAADDNDNLSVHSAACIMGALSMTSFVFTPKR